ncbi:S-layer homology domain-containing protein [Pseudarthrobacter sp. L19]|uniref:CAP and S-layer homology domain-containing protein n=1 Tax=Pseudarthrobacter sp. L19 TaxID=3423951 RepID=UPI003D7B430C
MVFRIIGVSLASSVLLSGAIVAGNPASALPAAAAIETLPVVAYQAEKSEILDRINAYRVENGLSPVVLNPALGTVAQNWSDKIAAAGAFKHNPDFSSQIPVGWSACAEIIAADSEPEAMVIGWQNSSSHNEILRDPVLAEVGIGYAYQGDPRGEYPGNYFATVNFASYAPLVPTYPVQADPPVFGATTYTIPSSPWVQYFVDGAPKSAGTYDASGPVTITAQGVERTDANFVITGTASWSKTYNVVVTPPAAIPVTAAAPVFRVTSYNIPAVPGVQYTVNGSVKEPGSYSGAGTITVTAKGLPGYVLTGTASWQGELVLLSDVPEKSAFHAEIYWLLEAGISTGWVEPDGTTTFRPLQPVKRDAMAAFMYRLSGRPDFTPPSVSPFSDISTGSQFYKEITWLASKGISTGWEEPNQTKTFRPLEPVNRDAMAAFMYRLAKSPGFTAPTSSPFKDVGQGQFYKEITWLASTGITTGWTAPDQSKTFAPLQPVNRDAMAAFMSRFHAKFLSS